tara:strand:- start:1062 stop:1826 length:765 start_codon:yes stop_codon:yes gene_type:complete
VIIPLFKSHYSIGKSILTLSDESEDEGSDSIFDIYTEAKLEDKLNNKIVIVEDSFMGFLQANQSCNKLGLDLVFGLRIDVHEDQPEEKSKHNSHKVIVFAKNSDGCKSLYKIYSESKSNECFSAEDLYKFWDSKNLDLFIPFYDSFLFKNLFLFNSFTCDFSKFNPTFIIEQNELPYDFLLLDYIKEYCNKNSFNTIEGKSIYYNKRVDFDAFVCYKLICSRNSFSAKKSSLDKPNLDHMGSREFCLESYLENA